MALKEQIVHAILSGRNGLRGSIAVAPGELGEAKELIDTIASAEGLVIEWETTLQDSSRIRVDGLHAITGKATATAWRLWPGGRTSVWCVQLYGQEALR